MRRYLPDHKGRTLGPLSCSRHDTVSMWQWPRVPQHASDHRYCIASALCSDLTIPGRIHVCEHQQHLGVQLLQRFCVPKGKKCSYPIILPNKGKTQFTKQCSSILRHNGPCIITIISTIELNRQFRKIESTSLKGLSLSPDRGALTIASSRRLRLLPRETNTDLDQVPERWCNVKLTSRTFYWPKLTRYFQVSLGVFTRYLRFISTFFHLFTMTLTFTIIGWSGETPPGTLIIGYTLTVDAEEASIPW